MTKKTIQQTVTVSLLALTAVLCAGSALAQGSNPGGRANDGASIGTQNTLGDYITSDLTVGFPLEAAVEDGAIRVLIPTATDSAIADAGKPATAAFVKPSSAAGVTVDCPSGITGMNFSTGTMESKYVLYEIVDKNLGTMKEIDPDTSLPADANGKYVRYLSFVCDYTGVGSKGGAIATDTVTSSTMPTNHIVIHGLINPSGPIGETINEAVVIPGKVQLMRSNYTDDYSKIADYLVSDYDVLISAIMQDVLVTAKVEYQIMFRIEGVPSNEDVCNNKVKTSVATTPTLVDYGAPTVGVPVDAAQRVYINSSVNNGYKVTVSQNGNMKRQNVEGVGTNDGNACANDGLINSTTINRDCIPNFGWPTLAPNAFAAWARNSNTGLGYTVAVQGISGDTDGDKNNPKANVGFEDGDKYTRLATRNADGTYGQSYYPDGGSASTAEPLTIASSDGLADGDRYDVCYRLAIDAQNNAGVYDNEITYTITASL